jgi:DUF1680 family protein
MMCFLPSGLTRDAWQSRLYPLIGCLGIVWFCQASPVNGQQSGNMEIGTQKIELVTAPPADRRSELYPGNRAPLNPSPLIRLPVGSVQPRGWLRKQLELQAAGFHGHLYEISPFLKKERNAWLAADGVGDHGWEEPPYWLKGFSNLAYILGDERLLRETTTWIEGALRSQKPDGWFGPDGERRGAATDLVGREDLWPNAIMLFCLQDYHDFSGDPRVIELMTKYFDYLIEVPDEKFLVGYWPRMRGGDLLLSVYWLYNRTGDERLLALADRVHRRTAPWSTGLIDLHNVNIAQGFREPATYWMQSNDPAHRQASYAVYDEVRQSYGPVPGGMFGGDENCRPGERDPRQAVETCGMAEMMFSAETLTWITGDLLWADRCEDVAYNSLPAALMPDLNALRYLTAPNMPLSDAEPKNPGLQNGGPMLLMSPLKHRCCQHNWGQAWPYFAEHAWYATSDHGLAGVHLVAATVKAKVAEGEVVTFHTETNYPFESTVRLRFEAGKPTAFPVYLRIPGWCVRPAVRINGEPIDIELQGGKFVRIERVWSNGDKVELELPMETAVQRWAENSNSASVTRGPLTFSVKIGEDYRRVGGSDEWPEYEIHPTTEWNYGLVLSGADPMEFDVVESNWPADDQPFTSESVPIKMRARVKKIADWQLDRHGLASKLQPSPVQSDEPEQVVELIPMGAARLRISAFPVIDVAASEAGAGGEPYFMSAP